MIAAWLFDGGGSGFTSNYVLPGAWAGLGVVLGHCFPFYLKFRGGKGISSTIGLLLMLDWHAAFVIFIIAFVLVLITRYISLSSLTITLLMPVAMVVRSQAWEVVAITVVLWGLAWFMHRGNIQRLVTGTERKFSFAKTPSPPE